MSDVIHIGDVVTPTGHLEDGDGADTPRGVIARPGHRLVVVETDGHWPLYVTHAPPVYPAPRRFGVKPDEVRRLADTCEPPAPPPFPVDLFDEPAPEVAEA